LSPRSASSIASTSHGSMSKILFQVRLRGENVPSPDNSERQLVEVADDGL
jgi:hypothetical protein